MSNRFYFSIIDDTDDATVENTKPVYDFLYRRGIKATKTVWVYPPRDMLSKGDSLQRPEYLDFIKDIKRKGFEIALHNVGSGNYYREEILNGLEEYRSLLGEYPRIQVNHSYNPDSIYGGFKRFNFPFRQIVKLFYPQYSSVFQGEEANSPFFWGDRHKQIITYNRNHESDMINTAKFDKYMPYVDSKRSDYSNYWFSATFAPNQWLFNRIVTPKNIEKLVRERGICIIITHLGYFTKDGIIDPEFVRKIDILSSNPNGIYLPVSEVLDHVVNVRESKGQQPYPVIPRVVKFKMELKHLLTRFKYRKVLKIDDYAFKNLDKRLFVSQR